MRYIATIAIAASLLAAAPSPAVTLSGLEGVGKPVPDSELAQMRGKFIAPGSISYFGVQMASSWQGGDGITTSAVLLFNVDFAKGAATSDGATPHLLVSWSHDGDATMDVHAFSGDAGNGYVALGSTGSAIPAGSMGTINGAVQGQQIAGSDNLARNEMRIQVVPAASLQTNVAGMKEVTAQGQETHSFGGGESVSFIFSGNQLGVGLTDQDGGLQQSLNGNLGSIAQQLVIDGNSNLVRNGMTITIGFDAVANNRQLSVTSALEVMKTRGF